MHNLFFDGPDVLSETSVPDIEWMMDPFDFLVVSSHVLPDGNDVLDADFRFSFRIHMSIVGSVSQTLMDKCEAERIPISLAAVEAQGEASLKCCIQMYHSYSLALSTNESVRTLVRSVGEFDGADACCFYTQQIRAKYTAGTLGARMFWTWRAPAEFSSWFQLDVQIPGPDRLCRAVEPSDPQAVRPGLDGGSRLTVRCRVCVRPPVRGSCCVRK